MNIKPSAAIRQNYNEIAELCRARHFQQRNLTLI